MAITERKKTKRATSRDSTAASSADGDLDVIKSEVASFASSLGLAAAAAGASDAGFDDSDFRKSGPLRPKPPTNPKPSKPPVAAAAAEQKPDPKLHPLGIDPFPVANGVSHSKYQIMKPSALSARWYAFADELELKVFGEEAALKGPPLNPEALRRLVKSKKEVAEQLMAQYAVDYVTGEKRRGGDSRLLEATARSGTSADKVSAFTCLVEENPIANIRALDALLSMVTSKVGKRYAFTGFDALKELFLLRLLPDRKLKCLFQRPLDRLPETKDGFSLLLLWHWEECLKQRYEKFIIALEDAVKDMLPNLKDRAMKTVFELLKTKPEQERRLLAVLVNKLGDPERKAASCAAFHLTHLLSAHPNMKAVVIDEVDSFLFRPYVGLRAKYQAVNFLSHILLSKHGDGPKIAKRLVDIYFALFKVIMSSSGNSTSSFVKHEKKCVKRRKYNGKHLHFKGGKHGHFKGDYANNNKDIESDCEMDSRLLSALLTGVNRAFPFVASNEADDLIEIQTPVLYKLVHSENFNVGVQALMLLYQITMKNQIASDRFYRALYAKLLSPAAISSSKPELFLGLLVKAMKTDIKLKRVAAFAKRILQVALQRPPQFACGCLFILSEVLKIMPPLWSLLLQNECGDDDEVEHFKDIEETPEVSDVKTTGTIQQNDPSNNRNCENDADLNVAMVQDGDLKVLAGSNLPAGYNPRHREPSYCNADRTSWWELIVLASHVHPSVSTMAHTLLSGANIVYNGDPLNDLSLPAFLDKFMEKKPKGNRIADGKWYGGSQIAPARKLEMNHCLIGEELLQLAEDEVPPEDVFFHRFYVTKTGTKRKAKKAREDDDDVDADELVGDISDASDDEIDDLFVPEDQFHDDNEDKEYDYEDLDQIADLEEDDLVVDDSDEEPVGSTKQIELSDGNDSDGGDDDNDFNVEVGRELESDDLSNVNGSSEDGGDDRLDPSVRRSKKRKHVARTGASLFASLEEYEDLIAGSEGVSRATGKKMTSGHESRKSSKKMKRKTKEKA